MARSTRRAFSFALYEAAECGRDQLSTAEVLLGLLPRGEGEPFDTLRSEGVDLETVRQVIQELPPER